MNKLDLLNMAFRNLRRRKSRTILTFLSVSIGTVSIIVMISLGIGIEKSQMDFINSSGGMYAITVRENYGEEGKAEKKINKSTKSELMKINHVSNAFAQKFLPVQLTVDGKNNYNVWSNLTVIDDDALRFLSDKVGEGKALEKNQKNVLLFGKSTTIYKQDDEIGQSNRMVPVDKEEIPKLNYVLELGYDYDDPSIEKSSKPSQVKIKMRYVGTHSKDSKFPQDGIYTNETTYKYILEKDKTIANPMFSNGQTNNNDYKFDSIMVLVDDVDNIEDVETAIRDLGYSTESAKSWANEMKNQFLIVQLVFGAIGSVAFIVSAIGIINTMTMAIYERIKEIGVMKVIGASVKDIRNMFLLESGLIGMIGGIIGLLLSIVISNTINFLINQQPEIQASGEFVSVSLIPFWLLLLGVSFSFLVGVLAGYIPARRATRLSAIDSLRSD
ncbi:MAG: ABC transporter permease [Peptoniphilaceae bacterium]|nr:ABC transporter permease [Peptoniphilaceae bacterium]MDY3738588.1 ABC transporter permease [Peptoniphilaceae bacterium]